MEGGKQTGAAATAYVLVALAALCWAGNHVLGRVIAGHVPPLAISAVRWIVPAVILLPFAWHHVWRDWPTIRLHWRSIAFLTLSGGALFGVLQYIGLQYTTAINVSVLNSVAPVLIVAAGAAIFGDRMGRRQLFGILTSLTGVLVVVTRGDVEVLAGLAFNWGDLIILLNMAIFGIYSACLRLRGEMHGMTFLFLLAFVSAIATLPLAVAEHASGYTLQPTWLTFGALLYASIFPSLVANAAWNRGIELIGPGRAGAFLHLIPLYSAIMAGLFLGEILQTYHLAGFALILLGVWLAARKA